MKKIKYLLMSVLIAATSCSESAIDDLQGIYKAPDDCQFTSAKSVSVDKIDKGLRVFDVNFTSSNGDVLNMKFVGDTYFLAGAAFTPAEAGALKKGNYIIGNGGSSYTPSGSSAKTINRGQVILGKEGDNYTISGTAWLEDGNVIRLHGGGTLVYEPDPEPIPLSKCLSYNDNNPNGTQSISLVLASEDISSSFNPATFQTVYSGTGNYLAVDFYSTDGRLEPGIYTPAESSAMSPMTYGKGWDPGDLWGIGIMFENWGTCWWTVTDGATEARHIEDGDIKVECTGGVYTISYNKDGIFFEYKGTIEGMPGEGGGDAPVEYTEIGNFLSASVNGTVLSLQVASDGISLTPNAWGGADVSGDGKYLKIDLFTADGTLAPGTYTPADNTALQSFNFAMGYDPGDLWGIGIDFKNWGTAWMSRADGQESGVNVTDGTIVVEADGSNYVITLTSSAANVRYSGPITM